LKTIGVTMAVGGWLAGPFLGSPAQLMAQRGQLPSGFDPEFQLLVYPQRVLSARIFYLSTVASPDTHMFEFKGEIDTRGLDLELKPGYTARIRVPLQTNPDALIIPEESLRHTERGPVAFVPVERKGRDGQTEWVARAREVEPGARAPGWVEIR